MQKPNLTKICRNVKTATVKHSPEILTGVGIAGMITTTVMAVRATPKAIQLLDEEKRRQQADKLEPMDVVKTPLPLKNIPPSSPPARSDAIHNRTASHQW